MQSVSLRVLKFNTLITRIKEADYADDGNSLIGVISIDKSMSWDSEYSEEYLDLQAKYVYANGMLLARYDESPADTHYYHHDGLGSVIGMTNENANVEQSYFYDDFGNSLGSWGNVNNHYLYTGQEYDGAISGLYNLRARYYDPGIGRFVSEDPVLGAQHSCYMSRCFTSLTYLQQVRLFEPIELNAYLYCGNNSINNRDITGLLVEWYAACGQIAGCILEECKKNIPPDYPCRGEEKEKCVDESYDWLLDCLRYKTTSLPPLPYYAYLCLGLINELFPSE